jgi:hypothetical protein
MPRNAILPIHRDPFGSLPNERRGVQQKIGPRRERSGAENIDGGEPTRPKSISPVLHLGMMTAWAASVVVVDNQASPGPRQLVYFADHDALARFGRRGAKAGRFQGSRNKRSVPSNFRCTASSHSRRACPR